MVISQILPDLAQICLPTPKSRLVASCGPFRLLHTTLVQICPQRNPNTATTTFFGGDYDHCLQGQGQIPHYGHKFLCLDELEVGLTGLKHWRVQCILYDSIIKMYVYLFMQCVHILNAYVYIYHILHILYIYICVLFHQQMACWTWLSMIIFYQGWSVTRCAKEMILKLFAFGCTGFFLGTDRACLGGHGWTVAGGWRRWPFMKTTGECSGLVGFIFYLWKHPEDLCKVVR